MTGTLASFYTTSLTALLIIAGCDGETQIVSGPDRVLSLSQANRTLVVNWEHYDMQAYVDDDASHTMPLAGDLRADLLDLFRESNVAVYIDDHDTNGLPPSQRPPATACAEADPSMACQAIEMSKDGEISVIFDDPERLSRNFHFSFEGVTVLSEETGRMIVTLSDLRETVLMK